MSPPLSTALREQIVAWRTADNLTFRQIATAAGCSVSTVHNVLATHAAHGQVTNPAARRTGRTRVLCRGDLDYLQSLLRAQPAMTLEDLRARLCATRGVDVSVSTMSRTLARLGYARGSAAAVSDDADAELLRTTWMCDVLGKYEDPEVFVFLDGNAVDRDVLAREEGSARAGRPCVQRAAFVGGTRLSVLPALSLDGIVALDMLEGSIAKENFLRFLDEKVVSILNPYPGKRSVVVMENYNADADADIRTIIEAECGARLVYLPPHSPDYNPIENALTRIKEALHQYALAYVDERSLPFMIQQAQAAVTEDDAIEWIQDCGYME